MLNAYESNGQVVLVSRNDKGELIKSRVASSFVFYVLRSELDAVPSLKANLDRSRHVRTIREEGSWYRIEWASKEARSAFLESSGSDETPNVFRRNNVTIYEGDINPVGV